MNRKNLCSCLKEFADGKLKCLITKPTIAGYGMNWQNCHNVIFVGLSDSFEAYYQSVRRCWRFGQKECVNCYIIDLNGHSLLGFSKGAICNFCGLWLRKNAYAVGVG